MVYLIMAFSWIINILHVILTWINKCDSNQDCMCDNLRGRERKTGHVTKLFSVGPHYTLWLKWIYAPYKLLSILLTASRTATLLNYTNYMHKNILTQGARILQKAHQISYPSKWIDRATSLRSVLGGDCKSSSRPYLSMVLLLAKQS